MRLGLSVSNRNEWLRLLLREEHGERRSIIKAKMHKLVVFTFLAAVLLPVASCTVTSSLQTDSQVVELGDAKWVQVEIRMDAGRLKIAGGADELLNADFKYNVASWKPKVKYEVNRGQGELVVEQSRGVRGIPLGTICYEWDLQLSDDVPMDLGIHLGAGKSRLELGSLSLSKLYIGMGAGDVTADLAGSSSLTELDVNMGAGDAKIDLTGDWKSDLDASVRGGAGEATLQLPRDIGVQVDVKGGMGKINAAGLERDGSVYVNDAYGRSKVTLNIDVKGGVGEINLEVEE